MDESDDGIEGEMGEREVLVTLAMMELLGSVSVVDTLVALGMTDIVEEARILADMEAEEDGDFLEDPEPDAEFPDPSDDDGDE